MSGEDVLLLVRHGESQWNLEKRCQGQSRLAPGLTETGRTHAARLARLLSARPSRLIASDLRRAVETAAPIAAGLKSSIELDPRLRERSFGDLEGMPLSFATPQMTGVEGQVVLDAETRPRGGESLRELYLRAGVVLDELLVAGCGRVVVVTHGGFLRASLAYLEGLPVEKMRWGAVANGAVLAVEPGSHLSPRFYGFAQELPI